MFIDEDKATERVDDEENLVNLILSISGSSLPRPDGPELIEKPDEIEPINGQVKLHHSGRCIGGKEVPIELKHAAGLLAQSDTIQNVADALGLNFNTVAMAKHGRSTFGKENPELKQRLELDLGKVRDKAMDRLLASLDLLDDAKIAKASAKDISGISANMAKVMSSTLPKDAVDGNRAQLIVYAPSFVQRNEYEIVEVGASK